MRRLLSNTPRLFLRIALLLWALAAAPGNLSANSANPYRLPPEVDAKVFAALEANYVLDFAEANRILDSLDAYRDENPIIDFGRLLTEWWRLTAAVLEEDHAASAPLLRSADACLDRAEALIRAGDPTGEGHLVKGATLGLLGRWHIKNRHWMKSYFIGKKAKAALERALEINPNLKDAHAGIGIYDYFVAKLPGIVRFLAFTGQKGDPQIGLREIDIALEQGRYTLVGTKAALTLVYLRNEKDPSRALQYIDEVLTDYPTSAFLRSLRAIALYDLNRPEELAAEADLQAEMLARGAFPADRVGQVHFTRGLAHFRQMEWGPAHAAYRQAVAEGDENDPYTTWAALHMANIVDVAGNRSTAEHQYYDVEHMTNRWGTRRLAARYLDTPFDPEKHMVRLLPD